MNCPDAILHCDFIQYVDPCWPSDTLETFVPQTCDLCVPFLFPGTVWSLSWDLGQMSTSGVKTSPRSFSLGNLTLLPRSLDFLKDRGLFQQHLQPLNPLCVCGESSFVPRRAESRQSPGFLHTEEPSTSVRPVSQRPLPSGSCADSRSMDPISNGSASAPVYNNRSATGRTAQIRSLLRQRPEKDGWVSQRRGVTGACLFCQL